MHRPNRFLRIAAAGLALAYLELGVLPQSAHAQEVHHQDASGGVITHGSLTIEGAFARATLPSAPVGGGYLTISNSGAEEDRLVGVSADVSSAVQLHQMAIVDGMMKMSELPDGIVIPAGGSVTLAPGGLHIMFVGLKQPFVEGATVPVTLTFERAGTVAVDLRVGSTGASAPAAHAH